MIRRDHKRHSKGISSETENEGKLTQSVLMSRLLLLATGFSLTGDPLRYRMEDISELMQRGTIRLRCLFVYTIPHS